MGRSLRKPQTTVQSVQSGSSVEFVSRKVPKSKTSRRTTTRNRTSPALNTSKTSSNDSDTTVASFRWGSTAPRSKRRRRSFSSPEPPGELHQLIQSLKRAESIGNHHRCLLILSYLLHARHLVNSKVIIQGRYGTIITKLTTSSNEVVARNARAVGELWKWLLLKELDLI